MCLWALRRPVHTSRRIHDAKTFRVPLQLFPELEELSIGYLQKSLEYYESLKERKDVEDNLKQVSKQLEEP